MHLRVRKLATFDSTEYDLIVPTSKTSTIDDLQKVIHNELKIEISKQKLYYAGKQLICDHLLSDYNIREYDVIQLLICNTTPQQNRDNKVQNNNKDEETLIQAKSSYYETGDLIDVIYGELGAWFEAKIINIFTIQTDDCSEENDYIFKVVMDRNEKTAPLNVKFNKIRPRSHYVYKQKELKPEMIVLVNYNIEKPTERGYWYDFKITDVGTVLKGTLLMGKNHESLPECTIQFKDDVMKIEQPSLLIDKKGGKCENVPLRKLPLYCNKCKDKAHKKCKECSCSICGEKNHTDKLIMCEECDCAYHIFCLDPPLTAIPPEAEWYCPDCKTNENEIVKAGEKLKTTNHSKVTKYWSKCTIVPRNYFGPIPGVDVGTCWKFRSQVAEAGVHRTAIAEIHGSENNGTYSIILSGKHEDDVDNGEEFYYTGYSGPNLAENQKINLQTCDQQLTKMNKALALNCNTITEKHGAFGIAEKWRDGKPIRVVRNYKLSKSSKYAPKIGNRYDGIYKVVEYFPELNKSNCLVWRYLLRRDDPTPPPWAESGIEYDIIYPPDYLKTQENNENSSKRFKVQPYQIYPEIQKLIDADFANKALWDECKKAAERGRMEFLEKIEDLFMCSCCREVVHRPVTTCCKHNICKKCLQKCLASEINHCPSCRFEFGKNYIIQINEMLDKALELIFPGYEYNH